MTDFPQWAIDALVTYRNAHAARTGNKSWEQALYSDWMSDHRRQWGMLRNVRNSFDAATIRAMLRTLQDQ